MIVCTETNRFCVVVDYCLILQESYHKGHGFRYFLASLFCVKEVTVEVQIHYRIYGKHARIPI